jgi:DNA-binding MarR family transcriptional regulator
MAELSKEAVERLLLLVADYGRTLTKAMADAAPDPELVSNVSLVALCTLDLHGPHRPGVLQEVTGLSSGGVSKLLDRMEQAGVIKRTYGGVPGDNRGVLVSITRRGRSLMNRFANAAAGRLPDTKAIVKEFAAALDGQS